MTNSNDRIQRRQAGRDILKAFAQTAKGKQFSADMRAAAQKLSEQQGRPVRQSEKGTPRMVNRIRLGLNPQTGARE